MPGSEITTAAMSVSRALVVPMTTDAWLVLRDGVARAFANPAEIVRQLDEARSALASGQAHPEAVAVFWQGRLETLLEGRPDLVPALTGLLPYVTPAPAPYGSVAGPYAAHENRPPGRRTSSVRNRVIAAVVTLVVVGGVAAALFIVFAPKALVAAAKGTYDCTAQSDRSGRRASFVVSVGDGTYTVTLPAFDGETESGTWSVSDGKLTITPNGERLSAVATGLPDTLSDSFRLDTEHQYGSSDGEVNRATVQVSVSDGGGHVVLRLSGLSALNWKGFGGPETVTCTKR
jgi:hypothetical protein